MTELDFLVPILAGIIIGWFCGLFVGIILKSRDVQEKKWSWKDKYD